MKLPLWVQKDGKWEPFPAEHLTCFPDGKWGVHWIEMSNIYDKGAREMVSRYSDKFEWDTDGLRFVLKV